MLTSQQLKLFRMLLDGGASDGEILAARAALRRTLEKEGISYHDLVDMLSRNVGAPMPGFQADFWKPPPPDYGSCTIPFGKNKGVRFRDSRPDELLSLRQWVLGHFGRNGKFSDLVFSIEKYLNFGKKGE